MGAQHKNMGVFTMSKIVKLGFVGLGKRTETLIATLVHLQDVEVVAICDYQQERIDLIKKILKGHGKPEPVAFTDYREMLKMEQLQAVLVPTSWNSHLHIAKDCMEAGKYVGIEVGGAASVDELWQLVHAYERTRTPCMMLENCCYGRNELMVLNMVRKGMFGELVYCEGGYEHCLRERLADLDHYEERVVHNLHRNGDLYPTHELGPVSKILGINRGNRFLSLTSTATKARSVRNYRRELAEKGEKVDPWVDYNEGDITVTVIRCANGEVITLTHGISLPRPYSRNGRVQGTKGIWLEDTKGIYIDGISKEEVLLDVAGNPYTEHRWDKVEDYYEEYDHPIWKAWRDNVVGGHGGMDALALQAFFDAVRNGTNTPIDVYDVAAWMAVTCLSEQSIAIGGAPVPFPDFTNGKWIDREPEPRTRWALDGIYEECFE